MHPCQTCALRHYPLFMPFAPSELKFMMQFRDGGVELDAGQTLYHEGDETEYFYTAKEGQGARLKHLPNGERQLVNFIFPGDVIGLQGTLSGGAAATAVAASPMRLCRFQKARLPELFREKPDRAFALTWIVALEEHFLGETIATLGQRTAEQRVAWALLKIHGRLSSVGLARDGQASFPFKQRDLADSLGLSLVHTNKTLSRLRPYARWENGLLSLTDPRALARIGMVDMGGPKERPLL